LAFDKNMTTTQKITCHLLAVTMTLASTSVATGAILTFSFSDPLGDNTGDAPDLSHLEFVFDNASGDYQIMSTATELHAFSGNFRLNINLFNSDLGTSQFPSFFSDTLNDFELSTSTTEILLSGNDSRLLSWQEGQRVSVGSASFGAPQGITAFGSGVRQNQVGSSDTGADQFGTDQLRTGASIEVATILRIPEPGTYSLLGLGFLSLIFCRPRRKSRTRRRS